MPNIELVFSTRDDSGAPLDRVFDLGLERKHESVTFDPAIEGEPAAPVQRRLVVKGTGYHLEEAEDGFRLVHPGGVQVNFQMVDLLVEPAAEGRWRVLSGQVVLSSAPAALALEKPLRLTGDGVEGTVSVAGRKLYAASWGRGDVRPLPTALEGFLPFTDEAAQASSQPTLRFDSADWTRWRRRAAATPNGWRVPVRGTLRVPLAASTLVVRPACVEWDGERLVLREGTWSEDEEDLKAGEWGKATWDADAVHLALEPSATAITGAWPEAIDFGVQTSAQPVALEPAAFESDPRHELELGETAPEAGLWLRGERGSWVELRNHGEAEPLELRAASVTNESRPATLLASTKVGAPRLEVLPDNCRGIEVVFVPHEEGWRLEKVVVVEPALRLSLPEQAYLARDLDAPRRPPHDRVGAARTAVLMSPLLLAPDDRPGVRMQLSLTASGASLQLTANPHTRLWRTYNRHWLDTPPTWATNDPDHARRPSRLRGLVGHALGAEPKLALAVGCVRPVPEEAPEGELPPPQWAPESFEDSADERPSFGLREAHLGVELWGHATNRFRTGLRHAVAALDDGYRVSSTSEPASNEEAPQLAPRKSTYVLGRYADEPRVGLRPLSKEAEYAAAAESSAWDAPVMIALSAGATELPFGLVEERWSSGELRRWGLCQELRIGPFAVRPEAREGKALSLGVSGEGGVEGRIELKLTPAGKVAKKVAGHIRVPASWFLPRETGRARWIELAGLELQNGMLQATDNHLWFGSGQDLTRIAFPHLLSAAWTAAGPSDFLVDGAPKPEEGIDVPPVEHELLPPLVVEEWILGEGPFFRVKVQGHLLKTDPRAHGSRLLITWAGRHEIEPQQLLQAGVSVKALTRAFVELERGEDTELSIVGGLLGWEAHEVFGLKPNVEPSHFPQVSVVWPAREPGDDGEPPRLELNGSWWYEHAEDRHRLDVHFLDASIELKSRNVPFEPGDGTIEVPALVRHRFPGSQHDTAYAFHRARVVWDEETPGLADLSAVVFGEERELGLPQSVAGLRARGIKGLRIDHSPPVRQSDPRKPARDGVLAALVCGPKHGVKTKITPKSPDTDVDFVGPRLSWMAGIEQLSSDPSKFRPTAAPAADGAEIRVLSGGIEALRSDVLLSTLVSVDGGSEVAWLPCPVLGELEEPAEPSAPRLWIIGARGLELLHELSGVPAQTPESELVELARRALVISGWHREAALETRAGEAVRWTLVDSPLLNRSVSLRRFAAGGKAPTASMRKEGDAVPVGPVPDRRPSPRLDAASATEAWRPRELGRSSGFVTHRAVPFEVEARQGLEPKSLAPGTPWALSPVAPTEQAGLLPALVEGVGWYPGHARPGERMGLALRAWESGEALSGGAMTAMRFPRWTESTLQIEAPRVVSEATGSTVLLSRDLEWVVRAAPGNHAVVGDPVDGVVVLRHGPGATEVHPEDPVHVWLFGKLQKLTLTLRATLPAALAAGEAPKVRVSVRHTIVVPGGDGPDTLHTEHTELELELAKLLAGHVVDFAARVNALPEKSSSRSAEVVLQLPERSEWPNGTKLEITHPEAQGDLSALEISRRAARASAPLGIVGVFRGEALLASGPEPSARWLPTQSDATGKVTWARPVRWSETGLRGELPDDDPGDVFYLEPTGAWTRSG